MEALTAINLELSTLVSTDATPLPVEITALDDAVCILGKDEASKRVDHLVLSEEACDGLWTYIQELLPEAVHPSARQSLKSLQSDSTFFEKFQLGVIEVPLNDNALIPIKGTDDSIYMHFVRNTWENDTPKVIPKYRKGPLIMNILDGPNT